MVIIYLSLVDGSIYVLLVWLGEILSFAHSHWFFARIEARVERMLVERAENSCDYQTRRDSKAETLRLRGPSELAAAAVCSGEEFDKRHVGASSP